jgi:hypothetical protein
MKSLRQFASLHRFAITTGSIGLVITTLAVTNDWCGAHFEYAVIPGTIVFLLISGGEAGGPLIMLHIGIVMAVLVNGLLYSLLGLILDKRHRLTTEE